MTEQYSNLGQTVLSATITSAQTTFTVKDASKFSATGIFRIVVSNFSYATDPLNPTVLIPTPTNPEIMICTSRSGNVLTVQRGQEGTTAQAHVANEIVAEVLTAGVMNALQTAINNAVPYTGATADLVMGSHNVSANGVTMGLITNTGGDTFHGLGINAGGSDNQADVNLNDSAGNVKFSFGTDTNTFYLSDGVAYQFLTIDNGNGHTNFNCQGQYGLGDFDVTAANINMNAGYGVFSNNYLLQSSLTGGILSGIFPDFPGLPIADWIFNAIQLSNFGLAYDTSQPGGMMRLDMRGSYPFFQLLYQPPGSGSTDDQQGPFQITSTSYGVMPSVMIGWPGGGADNTGTGNGENLQVHGDAYVGGRLHVVGAFGDSSNSSGGSGNYLTSTVTGTSWQTAASLARNNSLTQNKFNHFADAGNTTTTETDLYSDTIAAGQLATNGDKLIAEYAGIFISSASATRELRAYFGGTLIFDSGALSISAGSDAWQIDVTIIRESTSVVRCSVIATTAGASLNIYDNYTRITGLTLSNTQILKITGQAAGVGAATNDIVAKLGYVEIKPA